MTRPDAEWVAEALAKAGLKADIVGSLALKKQSHHDIDLTVQILEDRDYQTYWYALEQLGFRYAAGSADELIADPDIDVLVIATRHDEHAMLRPGDEAFDEHGGVLGCC